MPLDPALVKTFAVGDSGKPQEIRRFSDPALQASIANALASVTERSVILNLEKNETGYNAAIAAKLDGHWSIALGYHKAEWGHALGTNVKFAW